MSVDYAEVFARVRAAVSLRGLSVEVVDVVDPNTGDLDGRTILIDHMLGDEERLFVLLHLFGHCVQWNVSPDARTVGQSSFVPATADEFGRVERYEREASCFGVTVLHEAGYRELDQWLTDLWHADWLFLEHFYRTGERADPRSFHRAGISPVLAPLPIPAFEPRVWPRRYAF